MAERGIGEGAFGVVQVVRDRVRAISAESGVAMEHVLFMVAQENDDLSVYLDPDFTLRYRAFLSAMPNSATYWKLQKAVTALIREMREFGLDANIGLHRDKCLRCGTPLKGRDVPPAR